MIRIILLTLVLLMGCKPSDNPVFKLNKKIETEQIQQQLALQIREESMPEDTDTTFILSESDLPSNAIYFSITQNSFDSPSFLLNINIKDISGIYDTPITIEYDPSILQFQFNENSNSLIEGPIASRLRKFLPENLMTLLITPDPQNLGQLVISHSILEDLGLNQQYSGILFSIPFRAIAPADFKTSIGFLSGRSDILNRNGESINIQFYGGTITRTLNS